MELESQSRHSQSEHASYSTSTGSSGRSRAIVIISGGVSSSSGRGSVSTSLAAVPEQDHEGELEGVDQALGMAEGSNAQANALGCAAYRQDLAYLAAKSHPTFCP